MFVGRAVQHVGMCGDFPIMQLTLTQVLLFVIAACFGSNLL